MNHPSLRAVVAAGLLTSLLPGQAIAQTPDQIVKKAQDAVKAAKTLQMVMETTTSGAGPASGTRIVDVKLVMGQKMALKTRAVGKATGPAAAMGNVQLVDDGKTMYTYLEGLKQYSKGPSQAKTSGTMAAGITNMGGGMPGASYTKLADKTIDGTVCYAIKASPKAAAPNAPKNDLVLYFAKSTGLTKGVDMTMSMAQGPNGQPLKMNIATRVKSMKLNEPIPDSAFKFVPPPGAKEGQMQIPGLGGGGVRPGAPR